MRLRAAKLCRRQSFAALRRARFARGWRREAQMMLLEVKLKPKGDMLRNWGLEWIMPKQSRFAALFRHYDPLLALSVAYMPLSKGPFGDSKKPVGLL